MAACEHCSAELTGRQRRYCSNRCTVANYRATVPGYRERERVLDRSRSRERYTPVVHDETACVECGHLFRPDRADQVVCSRGCRFRRNRRLRDPEARKLERRRANQRRRARLKTGEPAESFTDLEVFDRDEWICQLCDEPVDPDLSHPDKRSASLDHVVPLARGGRHEWSNAQLAHLGCNSRKGARLESELEPATGPVHSRQGDSQCPSEVPSPSPRARSASPAA